MARLFGPLVGTFMAIYLDDILIWSKSEKEHAEHLNQVLTMIREAGYKVKLSKCLFCKKELLYLGHTISDKGMAVNDRKVQAVQDWPAPVTVKQVKQFLGLANYFRKFIPGYSVVSAPLTDLTRDNVPYVWSDKCNKAFTDVKYLLSHAPVLAFPDPDLPYVVISDASLLGTGAVLRQGDKPVAYTSSKFNNAEKNYQTTEQELLGVIRALVEWRCYLEGAKFPVTLVTDHNPLIFFSTQQTVSRRQARWSEYLQRFDHVWEFIPGRSNMADPLSRCPLPFTKDVDMVDASSVTLPPPPSLCAVQLETLQPCIREQVVQGYAQDPRFSMPRHLKGLKLDAQFLWRINIKGKPSVIKVPDVEAVRLAIMREMHDAPCAGHPGPERTVASVQRWFTWRGMVKYIHKYVHGCASCQQMKPRTLGPVGPLQPLPIPNTPWESVSMDLLTCLPTTAAGFDTIIVWVDRLTKHVVAVPCKLTIDAPGFAQLMIEHIVAKFGLPLSFVSDRDVRFTSSFFSTLAKAMDFRQCMSTSVRWTD